MWRSSHPATGAPDPATLSSDPVWNTSAEGRGEDGVSGDLVMEYLGSCFVEHGSRRERRRRCQCGEPELSSPCREPEEPSPAASSSLTLSLPRRCIFLVTHFFYEQMLVASSKVLAMFSHNIDINISQNSTPSCSCEILLPLISSPRIFPFQ